MGPEILFYTGHHRFKISCPFEELVGYIQLPHLILRPLADLVEPIHDQRPLVRRNIVQIERLKAIFVEGKRHDQRHLIVIGEGCLMLGIIEGDEDFPYVTRPDPCPQP